jgi:hypothetical protein
LNECCTFVLDLAMIADVRTAERRQNLRQALNAREPAALLEGKIMRRERILQCQAVVALSYRRVSSACRHR